MIPTLGWIGLIVAPFVLLSGDYLGLFAYAPISVALLAIGYCLGKEGLPTDRAASAPDSIA